MFLLYLPVLHIFQFNSIQIELSNQNMASVSSGSSGSLFGSLRRFDAYPKTMEDFRIKTCGGATSKFTKSY